jgi:hypothetical protein
LSTMLIYLTIQKMHERGQRRKRWYRANPFRRWANYRLNEYLAKNCTMDDERLNSFVKKNQWSYFSLIHTHEARQMEQKYAINFNYIEQGSSDSSSMSYIF